MGENVGFLERSAIQNDAARHWMVCVLDMDVPMREDTMRGYAVIVKVNGDINRVALDRPPGLAQIREWIGGGYIEAVPYFTEFEGHRCVVFCDEEGKLKCLPYNRKATGFWGKNRGNDILVGDVVILYGDNQFMRNL